LIGIVGTAAVATGFTGAAFLFYRERMMPADSVSEGID